MNAASESAAETLERWIVVDLERIRRLPERLRRLWPHELLPARDDGGSGPASTGDGDSRSASAGDDGGSGPASTAAGDEDAVVLDEPGTSRREPDVLMAWLAGFAAELNHTDVRVTVVVSSGVETLHLALCLGGSTGLAVLALKGEGLEGFSGHQLLRRIDPVEIGPVVEGLAGLVEQDCVLTLSWAAREGATGLEFLHRRDGRWFRPVLERSGGSVTVDVGDEAGASAVRMLLAAVLARMLTTGTRR
ncbi:hypothetical protein [Brevibacterium renqingii]|uniref:hypothetical protein n=1 Tax=Brevibacterium renqingii TaxID=2776916 RepID=UPI001ADF7B68|nr:hypothetical protein [Brevibacterium renqingii]